MATFTLTCPDCVEFNGDSIVETIDGMEDTIKGPGKFEGECVWAIHYYHASMDGDGDRCECESGSIFHVEQVDADYFPDLADNLGSTVHLGVSEQGFVYCEIVTDEEFDRHITECEANNDSDYE